MAAVLLCGCSAEKFLAPGQRLLTSVKLSSDDPAVATSTYLQYVRQKPNTKWFNLLKVPLGIYCLSSPADTAKPRPTLWQRIGEAPVIYSPQQTANTQNAIALALKDKGYLNASVTTTVSTPPNTHRTKIHYALHPGQPYTVTSITYNADDHAIDSLINLSIAETYLYKGMNCDLALLDRERTRITTMLRNHGYYREHKNNIHYEIDTLAGPANVTLHLYHSNTENNATYTIGEVRYDSTLPLRHKLIDSKTYVRPGQLYREQDVNRTYLALANLQAVNHVAIRMQETAPDTLACDISILPEKTNSLGVELEGTNTAGNLGVAATLSYTNRNLLRGSEQWSTKLKGAYEAITGLEGYTNQNYVEIGLETRLTFPRLIIPFTRTKRGTALPTSTTSLSLQFDTQERPEFHRRVLTALWNYQWSTDNGRRHHRFDIPSLNYVYMPWISTTFRQDYLETDNYRSALIRYAYENLLILNTTYSQSYSSARGEKSPNPRQRRTNPYQLQWSVESAGNLLYGLARPLGFHKKSDGQYSLFNVAFAQYIKLDIDYSKHYLLNARNTLAIHGAIGIAHPYGNSTIVPFEKRYFGGGANGVRGWSVRELGPGDYTGEDGRVDYINQTGNLKLLTSIELRSDLVWKLSGAVFADVGNIWTTRRYDITGKGGQFRFSNFWKQLAASYGIGLRFNLDYFILRFDMAMKAVNPAYPTSSKKYLPIVHPKMSRDFTFHFAVGLPF
ncbi:MAG: BamA/TamA family outer membrane protein [Bacteroidaceae bacterium]|nr:BamA/TamA family outer membrane protein [Bacteroidaceae bacterium]